MNLKPVAMCLASLTTVVSGGVIDAGVRVDNLRVEGQLHPAIVDTAHPRFGWRLVSEEAGAGQTAYQVQVWQVDSVSGERILVADPGRVESSESQWIRIGMAGLKPRSRYVWRVRVWDRQGKPSDWSAEAVFFTGLLGESWPAPWVSDGKAVPRKANPPARYIRQVFAVDRAPVQATLYLSAQGLVDPWLNGRRVTEDLFVPGWPDYTRRVFYVAYDVTEEMRVGENALGIVLGDGWYSGTMLRDQQAGPTPRVSAWIELYSADGGRRRVFLDGGARVAQGPIVLQGIYAGETYDARREQPDWATPGGAASWEWSNVVIEPTPPVAVTARFSPPVRRIEEIRPVAHRRAGPTVHRFDLGQNMVGWIRLKVRAAPGTEVIIRFAEMLEADGSLHLRNLRSAAATARYIARGDPQGEVWEPHFTFFGFRHVEVSGLETLPEDAVTGIVVHTDLRRIGSFECSAPLLNQLYRNTLWGQKGNFLELPTDCPQRDERLGWTGDAQVFCHTANYNLESYAFYRQWLRTLRDSFVDGPEGGFPSVAPNTGFIIGAAGWADAGVIVPWVVYLHSGDRRVLEESFDAARRWVDIMRAQAPDGIRRSRKAYGDWLAPGAPKPGEAPTPYVLIATAFYAHSADLVARMADVLGEVEQARHYRALFEEVRRAFQREFIAADGAIVSDEQTAYVLALAFDLVDEARRPAMVKHLESAIAAKDDHLATGFLGTYLLAPTLTKVGLTDLAYRIVQQETYPGWLFSVKNGATTIWERWDSWTPEQGFHPEGMNSFNHYAYGAIVGWFYHTVAGIRPDPRQPGWRRFILAPEPGGGLTFARASLETPYGRVASYWKVEAGGWSWEVEVPANTSAEVHLPVETAEDVVADGRDLLSAQGVSDVREADGRVAFRLDSGAYRFRVRAP